MGYGLFTTIKHFNSENEFFFYPNPAQHYITINKTLYTDKISIFNLTGCKIYEFSLDKNDLAPINISVLPDGIYWVKAVDSEKTYTAKMIKISR